jgi:hypothetical protein
MTRFKTLSAIVVLSAMVATPVLAQDSGMPGPGSRVEHHKFYRSYNQLNAFDATPITNEEYWNLQNFGTTGRNPSRVGGESPWLNPPS